MDNKRLELEKQVLARKLPPNMYMFREMGTANAHLLIGARTNSKKVYTLKIMLDDFPHNVPEVYTTKTLLDRAGNPMQVSHENHCLGSSDKWTKLCHYPEDLWTPAVSLYKVFIKCRLWLEFYEAYLRTGRSIDSQINEINRQGGNSPR